jgi:uncharacterized membrane protein
LTTLNNVLGAGAIAVAVIVTDGAADEDTVNV